MELNYIPFPFEHEDIFPMIEDPIYEDSCPIVEELTCPECRKKFEKYHNLRSHMAVHASTKPFRCPECSMCFRRNHDLRRHFRQHMGVKPFICPKCNKQFSRSDALKRHSKIDKCRIKNDGLQK